MPRKTRSRSKKPNPSASESAALGSALAERNYDDTPSAAPSTAAASKSPGTVGNRASEASNSGETSPKKPIEPVPSRRSRRHTRSVTAAEASSLEAAIAASKEESEKSITVKQTRDGKKKSEIDESKPTKKSPPKKKTSPKAAPKAATAKVDAESTEDENDDDNESAEKERHEAKSNRSANAERKTFLKKAVQCEPGPKVDTPLAEGQNDDNPLPKKKQGESRSKGSKSSTTEKKTLPKKTDMSKVASKVEPVEFFLKGKDPSPSPTKKETETVNKAGREAKTESKSSNHCEITAPEESNPAERDFTDEKDGKKTSKDKPKQAAKAKKAIVAANPKAAKTKVERNPIPMNTKPTTTKTPRQRRGKRDRQPVAASVPPASQPIHEDDNSANLRRSRRRRRSSSSSSFDEASGVTRHREPPPTPDISITTATNVGDDYAAIMMLSLAAAAVTTLSPMKPKGGPSSNVAASSASLGSTDMARTLPVPFFRMAQGTSSDASPSASERDASAAAEAKAASDKAQVAAILTSLPTTSWQQRAVALAALADSIPQSEFVERQEIPTTTPVSTASISQPAAPAALTAPLETPTAAAKSLSHHVAFMTSIEQRQFLSIGNALSQEVETLAKNGNGKFVADSLTVMAKEKQSKEGIEKGSVSAPNIIEPSKSGEDKSVPRKDQFVMESLPKGSEATSKADNIKGPISASAIQEPPQIPKSVTTAATAFTEGMETTLKRNVDKVSDSAQTVPGPPLCPNEDESAAQLPPGAKGLPIPPRHGQAAAHAWPETAGNPATLFVAKYDETDMKVPSRTIPATQQFTALLSEEIASAKGDETASVSISMKTETAQAANPLFETRPLATDEQRTLPRRSTSKDNETKEITVALSQSSASKEPVGRSPLSLGVSKGSGNKQVLTKASSPPNDDNTAPAPTNVPKNIGYKDSPIAKDDDADGSKAEHTAALFERIHTVRQDGRASAGTPKETKSDHVSVPSSGEGFAVINDQPDSARIRKECKPKHRIFSPLKKSTSPNQNETKSKFAPYKKHGSFDEEVDDVSLQAEQLDQPGEDDTAGYEEGKAEQTNRFDTTKVIANPPATLHQEKTVEDGDEAPARGKTERDGLVSPRDPRLEVAKSPSNREIIEAEARFSKTLSGRLVDEVITMLSSVSLVAEEFRALPTNEEIVPTDTCVRGSEKVEPVSLAGQSNEPVHPASSVSQVEPALKTTGVLPPQSHAPEKITTKEEQARDSPAGTLSEPKSQEHRIKTVEIIGQSEPRPKQLEVKNSSQNNRTRPHNGQGNLEDETEFGSYPEENRPEAAQETKRNEGTAALILGVPTSILKESKPDLSLAVRSYHFGGKTGSTVKVGEDSKQSKLSTTKNWTHDDQTTDDDAAKGLIATIRQVSKENAAIERQASSNAAEGLILQDSDPVAPARSMPEKLEKEQPNKEEEMVLGVEQPALTLELNKESTDPNFHPGQVDAICGFEEALGVAGEPDTSVTNQVVGLSVQRPLHDAGHVGVAATVQPTAGKKSTVPDIRREVAAFEYSQPEVPCAECEAVANGLEATTTGNDNPQNASDGKNPGKAPCGDRMEVTIFFSTKDHQEMVPVSTSLGTNEATTGKRSTARHQATMPEPVQEHAHNVGEGRRGLKCDEVEILDEKSVAGNHFVIAKSQRECEVIQTSDLAVVPIPGATGPPSVSNKTPEIPAALEMVDQSMAPGNNENVAPAGADEATQEVVENEIPGTKMSVEAESGTKIEQLVTKNADGEPEPAQATMDQSEKVTTASGPVIESTAPISSQPADKKEEGEAIKAGPAGESVASVVTGSPEDKIALSPKSKDETQKDVKHTDDDEGHRENAAGGAVLFTRSTMSRLDEVESGKKDPKKSEIPRSPRSQLGSAAPFGSLRELWLGKKQKNTKKEGPAVESEPSPKTLNLTTASSTGCELVNKTELLSKSFPEPNIVGRLKLAPGRSPDRSTGAGIIDPNGLEEHVTDVLEKGIEIVDRTELSEWSPKHSSAARTVDPPRPEKPEKNITDATQKASELVDETEPASERSPEQSMAAGKIDPRGSEDNVTKVVQRISERSPEQTNPHELNVNFTTVAKKGSLIIGRAEPPPEMSEQSTDAGTIGPHGSKKNVSEWVQRGSEVVDRVDRTELPSERSKQLMAAGTTSPRRSEENVKEVVQKGSELIDEAEPAPERSPEQSMAAGKIDLRGPEENVKEVVQKGSGLIDEAEPAPERSPEQSMVARKFYLRGSDDDVTKVLQKESELVVWTELTSKRSRKQSTGAETIDLLDPNENVKALKTGCEVVDRTEPPLERSEQSRAVVKTDPYGSEENVTEGATKRSELADSTEPPSERSPEQSTAVGNRFEENGTGGMQKGSGLGNRTEPPAERPPKQYAAVGKTGLHESEKMFTEVMQEGFELVDWTEFSSESSQSLAIGKPDLHESEKMFTEGAEKRSGLVGRTELSEMPTGQSTEAGTIDPHRPAKNVTKGAQKRSKLVVRTELLREKLPKPSAAAGIIGPNRLEKNDTERMQKGSEFVVKTELSSERSSEQSTASTIDPNESENIVGGSVQNGSGLVDRTELPSERPPDQSMGGGKTVLLHQPENNVEGEAHKGSELVYRAESSLEITDPYETLRLVTERVQKRFDNVDRTEQPTAAPIINCHESEKETASTGNDMAGRRDRFPGWPSFDAPVKSEAVVTIEADNIHTKISLGSSCRDELGQDYTINHTRSADKKSDPEVTVQHPEQGNVAAASKTITDRPVNKLDHEEASQGTSKQNQADDKTAGSDVRSKVRTDYLVRKVEQVKSTELEARGSASKVRSVIQLELVPDVAQGPTSREDGMDESNMDPSITKDKSIVSKVSTSDDPAQKAEQAQTKPKEKAVETKIITLDNPVNQSPTESRIAADDAPPEEQAMWQDTKASADPPAREFGQLTQANSEDDKTAKYNIQAEAMSDLPTQKLDQAEQDESSDTILSPAPKPLVVAGQPTPIAKPMVATGQLSQNLAGQRDATPSQLGHEMKSKSQDDAGTLFIRSHGSTIENMSIVGISPTDAGYSIVESKHGREGQSQISNASSSLAAFPSAACGQLGSLEFKDDKSDKPPVIAKKAIIVPDANDKVGTVVVRKVSTNLPRTSADLIDARVHADFLEESGPDKGTPAQRTPAVTNESPVVDDTTDRKSFAFQNDETNEIAGSTVVAQGAERPTELSVEDKNTTTKTYVVEKEVTSELYRDEGAGVGTFSVEKGSKGGLDKGEAVAEPGDTATEPLVITETSADLKRPEIMLDKEAVIVVQPPAFAGPFIKDVSSKVAPVLVSEEAKNKPDEGTGAVKRVEVLVEPPPSLDKLKAQLYTEAAKVHEDIDQKFVEYWDAMKKRFDRGNTSDNVEASRVTLNGFLKTKKLRKLHNEMIKAILRQCLRSRVSFDEISPFMPPQWRKRVKISNETSAERPTKYRKTGFGLTEKVGYLPAIGGGPARPQRFKRQNHTSLRIPAALSIEPEMRALAQGFDMKVSENAVWMVVAGAKEYASAIMQGCVSQRKLIHNNKMKRPQRPRCNAQIGRPEKKPRKDSGLDIPQNERVISTSDVHGFATSLPMGSIGSFGGTVSRLACERTLMATAGINIPPYGPAFYGLKHFIWQRIAPTSLTPIVFQRDAELLASLEPSDLSTTQIKGGLGRGAKDLSSISSSNTGGAGRGRGGKDLAGLTGGLGRGAKDLASLKQRSSFRADGEPLTDISERGSESSRHSVAAVRAVQATASQNLDAGVAFAPQSEGGHHQSAVTGRRGKGYGIKDLAAMRARGTTGPSPDGSAAPSL